MKEAENGVPVPELCREYGMSSASFYKWRSKYGGMDVSMMNRLKELELNMRIKLRKRIQREKPEPLSQPDAVNQAWSIGFMHDQLGDWRSVRLFNILEDFNREGLGIEIDLSLPTERVVRSLDNILEWRGKPEMIRCDNGPEFTSRKFQAWAEKRNIRIEYIQPGKPQQNAYIGRYNRTVRYDWLSHYIFGNVDELREHATRWL